MNTSPTALRAAAVPRLGKREQRRIRRQGADDGRRLLPSPGETPAVIGELNAWLEVEGTIARRSTRETLADLTAQIAALNARKDSLAHSAGNGPRQQTALLDALTDVESQIAALVDRCDSQRDLLADMLQALASQAQASADAYWTRNLARRSTEYVGPLAKVTAPAWFANPL